MTSEEALLKSGFSKRDLQKLKNNIENPNNTILIVGWQAEHTLGRRLVERFEGVP